MKNLQKRKNEMEPVLLKYPLFLFRTFMRKSVLKVKKERKRKKREKRREKKERKKEKKKTSNLKLDRVFIRLS